MMNAETKLRKRFYAMKQRCYGKGNKPMFLYYRDKGIRICDEWLNDVDAFVKWSLENGYQEGLTIDRIDPDGDYEPSNCRWISLHDNCVHATSLSGRMFYVVSGHFDRSKGWVADEVVTEAMSYEDACAFVKEKVDYIRKYFGRYYNYDHYRVSNTKKLDWKGAKFRPGYY